MPAGGRELERPPRPLLPAHVGQVGLVGLRRLVRRLGRRRPQLAAQVRDRLGEMADRDRLDAAELRLAGRLGARRESGRDPARRAPSATANAPRTGRTRPSSASSPTAACSASRSAGSCREAASTASAIERSKPEPSLRRPAGARLTVIRFSGHSSWAEPIPLRTRCFASAQARSARPTIANPGRPPSMCASTSTRRGSRPTRAWVTERASTPSTLEAHLSRVVNESVPTSRHGRADGGPALGRDVDARLAGRRHRRDRGALRRRGLVSRARVPRTGSRARRRPPLSRRELRRRDRDRVLVRRAARLR